MSRRYDDRYDDRQSGVSRRPRNDRDYDDEVDIDIRQSRYDAPPARTAVRERDAETVTQGRRGPRQPDFLREDYGRNANAGQLVVREEIIEDDYVARAPQRRRSLESVRSRAPPQRVEKEEIIIRERERDNVGPPYPRSERGSFSERDEVYRDRPRSRAPPQQNRDGYEEEIDIRIRETERDDRPPPPRSNLGGREENRFRRGDEGPPPMRGAVEKREEVTFIREERDRPPPPREVEREEIVFRDTVRSPPPREQPRGRGRDEEIDIDIRESGRGRGMREEEIDINIRDRSAPPPRQRSQSRGVMVKKDHEEWVVRRRRTPSPSPSPPPREFEREQIIIRRKERSPSPEPLPPPREPSPEPLPPPPEPIYRPPIIQEVITHHRHIDHGIERARSPTPPPAPAPPSPPKEEDLEISIRRQGTRNGKNYDEEITFERDVHETPNNRQVSFPDRTRDSGRDVGRTRSAAPPQSRRYDDDVSSEADYYNRRVTSRGYPGEAYNGATKDWGLVDIPPGTERVELDGVGGGRQELTWNRYNGDRRGKFYTGDRVYDEGFGNNGPPAPAPLPAPVPERTRNEDISIHISNQRGGGEDTTANQRRKTRDRMWTEVAKDLVIREAIDEKGYEFEETEEFWYVMQYLQYVSLPYLTSNRAQEANKAAGGRPRPRHHNRRYPPPAPRPHPRTPVRALVRSGAEDASAAGTADPATAVCGAVEGKVR